MASIRQPAVAGMFYPADAAELHKMISAFLADAEPGDAGGKRPKAIIAPHAGYVYSGPIAASVYARLKQASETITRVVLLGPSHRVPLIGLALPETDEFLTPLGKIPLDKTAMQEIESLPHVKRLDAAHTMEHSLEVQLPFLQQMLGDFQLVPLVVGDATPEQVADVLDALWGGEETLIVISSDLSHYHDYDTAKRMDGETSKAIEALAPERIGYDQACGRNGVNGLLTLARRRGLHAETVDLRNSGDTAGPRDQVVGYGAYIVN